MTIPREISVNPKTYAFMGFRAVAVKDHRETGPQPVKKGQILGLGGLIKGLFVSKPGQRS